MFVVAYPRETQEMVLDAHSKVFAYFGVVPKRMVYDNLKTVVDGIFVGKTALQSAFFGLSQSLFVRAGRVYPGIGLGKRPGGKSSRQYP